MRTCKKHIVYKYVQVLVAENLSFHSVRLLCHNGTSKPVKVPILPLALLAAVAGKLTARTTFKVLSFFGWFLTIRTNTIYTGTAHDHIVVTIVTISGVQNFTKNCLFAHRQQVRIRSWAWCWIFRRHQVPVTTTSKTGIFQFLYTHMINICILLVLFWRSKIWFSS